MKDRLTFDNGKDCMVRKEKKKIALTDFLLSASIIVHESCKICVCLWSELDGYVHWFQKACIITA
jgi:hypothetical protein